MNNVANHMARIINFNLSDDTGVSLDFGTYSLIMYYTKELDFDIGQKLFCATLSEYEYRLDYNIDLDNISENDFTAHFVTSDIQQVIGFIDSQVIPALNAEQQGLFLKYGGFSNYLQLNFTGTDYMNNICIGVNDYFDDDPQSIVDYTNILKELLQSALDLGQAYTVMVL